MMKHHLALAAVHFVLGAILLLDGAFAHAVCVFLASIIYGAMGRHRSPEDKE
jgi:hypothetical protein